MLFRSAHLFTFNHTANFATICSFNPKTRLDLGFNGNCFNLKITLTILARNGCNPKFRTNPHQNNPADNSQNPNARLMRCLRAGIASPTMPPSGGDETAHSHEATAGTQLWRTAAAAGTPAHRRIAGISRNGSRNRTGRKEGNKIREGMR